MRNEKQGSLRENLGGPIRPSHSLRAPWEDVQMGWMFFVMVAGIWTHPALPSMGCIYLGEERAYAYTEKNSLTKFQNMWELEILY